MKKIVILMGILFISGFFLVMFFGCATPQEAVKEEEVPKEEKVVKEEPVKEEPKKEEVVAAAVDSDEDGVSDDKDKCPDTPYGIKVDASGCPLDSDGDGVYDYLDMCSGTAKGVKVDPFGCPEGRTEGVAQLKEGVFTVVLEFDTNSANIRPIYYTKYTKEVEKIKKANPEAKIVKVVINGHTDSTGTGKYNYQLSEKRANSVKRFVVDQLGVNSKLIKIQAFGATKPVASNGTSAGRQKNRRVEIIFTVKDLRE
jgi:OOP family OmpA-OmpF porin